MRLKRGEVKERIVQFASEAMLSACRCLMGYGDVRDCFSCVIRSYGSRCLGPPNNLRVCLTLSWRVSGDIKKNWA